jgi:O-antigen/teichoic acid export membrane protein
VEEATSLAGRDVSAPGIRAPGSLPDSRLAEFWRRLFRNASWGFASTWVESGAIVMITTITARALGAADYGRVALAMAAVWMVKQFVDLRTWEGVTRYVTTFVEEGRPGLALATLKFAAIAESCVAVVSYGLAVAASGMVADRYLGAPELQGAIALYALTLLTSAFDAVARAVLRVFDRFRDLAVLTVIESLCGLGIMILVLAIHRSVKAVLMANLLADLVEAAMLGGLALRQVRQRLWPARADAGLSLLRPHLKPLLKFMGQTALRATLKMNRHLDTLVIGHFRSPAEVAYYRVARRLATALEDLSNPFYFAIFPELSRVWTKTRSEFPRVVARTAIATLKVALPGTVLMILLAPAVVRGLMGAVFEPAVTPFRFLLIGVGVAVATFWGTPTALSSGRPGLATAAVALGVLTNVALLLLLVPAYGATGAAIATIGGAVAYAGVVGVLLPSMLRQRP